MKRIILLGFLFFASPALAADNSVLLTPCGSGCVTMRSKDIGGGVESMVHILGDTSGNPVYGTAGSANANILTVQGIASMTPFLSNPGTAANWGVGATGSAVPANGIYLGMNVGGNLTGLAGTANGVKVDGSAVTQPVSAASLPLPTGAATASGLTTINTTLGSPFQAGGSIGNTSFGSATSPVVTNPTSTLTLTSTTTAYSPGNIIANNATAGSITVPSFAIANSAGGAVIKGLRLTSNDSTSTAWGGATIQIDLWSAAPTFTNGDRGAYAVATGSAGYLGSYSGVLSPVAGDGVYGIMVPTVGNDRTIKLASGTSVFWTMQAITGSGVTGASKVFTVSAELVN